MDATLLQGALPVAVKMLAGSLDVKVRFAGKKPYWDGAVMNMSLLPLFSTKGAILGFGIMIHECGHAKFTEINGYPSKLHSCIGNALEDPRIENLMMHRYPGARYMLKQLVDVMLEDGLFGPPSDTDALAELVGFYALFRLRSNFLGQQAVAHLAKAYEMALEARIPKLLPAVRSIIDEAQQAKSKAEVLVLTERILELLKDALDADPHGKPDDDLGSTDLGDISQGLFAEMADAAIAEKCPNLPDAATQKAGFDPSAMITHSMASTNALRSRLEDLLEGLTVRRWAQGYSGTHVNTRNLWKLKVGDGRVFERKSTGVGLDVAVLTLIDRSPSMEENIDLATEVAYSITNCLESIDGISTCTAAFPAPHSDGTGVLVLTEFEDTLQRTASRYSGIGTFGATPLAEALLWAHSALLSQKAQRRILFIEADGQEDNPSAVQKILASIRESEIEVYAIGLNADVSHLTATSVRISDIEQLAPAVFGMLEQAIVPMAA